MKDFSNCEGSDPTGIEDIKTIPEVIIHSVTTPKNQSRTRIISLSINGGKSQEVSIRLKCYDVLHAIIEGNGKIVRFQNTIYDEIKELNKILGEGIIKNIQGIGYYIGEPTIKKSTPVAFYDFKIFQVDEDWNDSRYAYILEPNNSNDFCFISKLEYGILSKLREGKSLTKSEQENKRRIKTKLQGIGVTIEEKRKKKTPQVKKRIRKTNPIPEIHKKIIEILSKDPGETYTLGDLFEILEILAIKGLTKEAISKALENIGKTPNFHLLSQVKKK